MDPISELTSNNEKNFKFFIITPPITKINAIGNKIIRKVIEIKNLMVFPVVFKIRTSDSRAVEANKNQIKLNSKQSEKVELIIHMEKLCLKKNLAGESFSIYFESDICELKYPIIFTNPNDGLNNKNNIGPNKSSVNSLHKEESNEVKLLQQGQLNPSNILNNNKNTQNKTNENYNKLDKKITNEKNIKNTNKSKTKSLVSNKVSNDLEYGFMYECQAYTNEVNDNLKILNENNYQTFQTEQINEENGEEEQEEEALALKEDHKKNKSSNNANKISDRNVNKEFQTLSIRDLATGDGVSKDKYNQNTNLNQINHINNTNLQESNATFCPNFHSRESLFSSVNTRNNNNNIENLPKQMGEKEELNYEEDYNQIIANFNSMRSHSTSGPFNNNINLEKVQRNMSNIYTDSTINIGNNENKKENIMKKFEEYRRQKQEAKEMQFENLDDKYRQRKKAENDDEEEEYEKTTNSILKDQLTRLLFYSYEDNKKNCEYLTEIVDYFLSYIKNLELKYTSIYENSKLIDNNMKIYNNISENNHKNRGRNTKEDKKSLEKLKDILRSSSNHSLCSNGSTVSPRKPDDNILLQENAFANKKEIMHLKNLLQHFLHNLQQILTENFLESDAIIKKRIESSESIPKLTYDQVNYLYKEIQNLYSMSSELNSYKVRSENLLVHIEDLKKNMTSITASLEDYKLKKLKAENEKKDADQKLKQLIAIIKAKDKQIDKLNADLKSSNLNKISTNDSNNKTNQNTTLPNSKNNRNYNFDTIINKKTNDLYAEDEFNFYKDSLKKKDKYIHKLKQKLFDYEKQASQKRKLNNRNNNFITQKNKNSCYTDIRRPRVRKITNLSASALPGEKNYLISSASKSPGSLSSHTSPISRSLGRNKRKNNNSKNNKDKNSYYYNSHKNEDITNSSYEVNITSNNDNEENIFIKNYDNNSSRYKNTNIPYKYVKKFSGENTNDTSRGIENILNNKDKYNFQYKSLSPNDVNSTSKYDYDYYIRSSPKSLNLKSYKAHKIHPDKWPLASEDRVRRLKINLNNNKYLQPAEPNILLPTSVINNNYSNILLDSNRSNSYLEIKSEMCNTKAHIEKLISKLNYNKQSLFNLIDDIRFSKNNFLPKNHYSILHSDNNTFSSDKPINSENKVYSSNINNNFKDDIGPKYTTNNENFEYLNSLSEANSKKNKYLNLVENYIQDVNYEKKY